ncbi:MAG: TIGR03016 family PEP-CTERM system-associated outer membrane protein [Thermodesulfovibrionales bacterium]
MHSLVTSATQVYKKMMLLYSSIFLIFLFCNPANGAEFSFKPSIAVRQAYDDNIHLTKEDRESDFITRVLPSFNMQYKSESWDLSSDYTLNWWYYWKIKEGKDSHNLNLASQVRVIKNLLYLDVSDTYSSVILNPRRPSTDINLETNRSDSNNANISPYVKYQITPLLSLSSGYKYANIWYREKNGVNRQMHTGFATVEYKFSPTLITYLSVEHTYDRPEKNTSDEANQQTASFFRAVYTLNPQTDLNASIGYRWISFSNNRRDNMILYSVLLTHRLGGTGRVELRADSTFTPSPELGVMESYSEQLNLIYGETFIVNGGIFHRINRYLETGRKDIAIGSIAGIEYKLNPRLTTKVSGRYEKNKFLPEDRNREIYGASGEISYLLTKKAALSLSYNYTRGISRIDTDDYWDNVIAVEINLTF